MANLGTIAPLLALVPGIGPALAAGAAVAGGRQQENENSRQNGMAALLGQAPMTQRGMAGDAGTAQAVNYLTKLFGQEKKPASGVNAEKQAAEQGAAAKPVIPMQRSDFPTDQRQPPIQLQRQDFPPQRQPQAGVVSPYGVAPNASMPLGNMPLSGQAPRNPLDDQLLRIA